MMINSSGVAIRINVRDISVTSRSAMGVTLMRTNEEQKVVAITKISGSDEDEVIQEELVLDEEGNPIVSEVTEENLEVNEENIEVIQENSDETTEE